MARTVPVIDISGFRHGDEEGKRRVAQQVGAACEQIGFLTITGHGISEALIQQIADVSRRFLDLPMQ